MIVRHDLYLQGLRVCRKVTEALGLQRGDELSADIRCSAGYDDCFVCKLKPVGHDITLTLAGKE
jgi:hypothetical protein